MRDRDRQQTQNAEPPQTLPMPGVVTENSPVDQLPFPGSAPLPAGTGPLMNAGPQLAKSSAATAVVTGALTDLPSAPPTSGELSIVLPGSFTPAAGTTTTARQPIVIPGTGKKSDGMVMAPKPQGRRVRTHLAVTVLSVLVLLGVLITIAPLAANGQPGNLSVLFSPHSTMSTDKSGNTALIASQAATATAVTQDGYDPGGGQTYVGVQAAPQNMTDAQYLNRFFYGQCTYWANYRYHQLTGNWVTWLGNAYQWAYQAPAYGWTVSSTPNPNGPSIIVLQPYVQDAGYYGHVAVVEKINADGSVYTSNWNWTGWAVLSYQTFKVGSGVSFIWK